MATLDLRFHVVDVRHGLLDVEVRLHADLHGQQDLRPELQRDRVEQFDDCRILLDAQDDAALERGLRRLADEQRANAHGDE